MKTLVQKSNNLSLYLLEDSVSVTMTTENITVGDPVKFIIADCNSTNTTLHEGVSSPDAWIGHKYFYNGSAWSLNSDWEDLPKPSP